ncbi:hypothetical protein JCM5353_007136 [Sporobolomyces roseus]
MSSQYHPDQNRDEDSGSASSPAQSRSNQRGGGGGSGSNKKAKRAPQAEGRRHLSCENCRIRKMRCSRTSPCLSCKMRGDDCVWVGAAPNGSALEDDIEASAGEVNRLKKLVDLLLGRLEQQDQDVARHFPDGVLPPPGPMVYSNSSSNLPPSSHSHPQHPPYDPHHPYSHSTHASYDFQGNSDIVVEGDSLREIGGAQGIVYPEFESRSDAAESSREVWGGYGVVPTSGESASGSVMAEYQSQYK